MGYVKDWESMFEELFGGMFFEARIIFGEDGLEDEYYREGVHFKDDERYPLMQKSVRLQEREFCERGESFDKGLNVFKRREAEAFEREYAHSYNFHTRERYAADFENTVEGIIFGNEEKGAEFEKLAEEGEKISREVYEKILNPRSMREIAVEETFVQDDYAEKESNTEKFFNMSRSKREQILESFKNGNGSGVHDVKIEMINNSHTENEFDIDEAIDTLSERLCELMAKSADGLYL